MVYYKGIGYYKGNDGLYRSSFNNKVYKSSRNIKKDIKKYIRLMEEFENE